MLSHNLNNKDFIMENTWKEQVLQTRNRFINNLYIFGYINGTTIHAT